MRTFYRKLVYSRTSGVRKKYSLTGSHRFAVLGELSSYLLEVTRDASLVKVPLLPCCSVPKEARWSASTADFLTNFWIIGSWFLPVSDSVGLILKSLDAFEALLLASDDTNWVSVSFKRIPFDFGMWTTFFALLMQELDRPFGVLLTPLICSKWSASLILKTVLKSFCVAAKFCWPFWNYTAWA